VNILVISSVDPMHASHNRIHELLSILSSRHQVDIISTYAWWLENLDKRGYSSDYYKGEIQETLSKVRVEYLSKKRQHPIIQECLVGINIDKILQALQGRDYQLLFNHGTILSGLLVSYRFPTVPMIYDIFDDIATMAANSPTVPDFSRPVVRIVANWLINKTISRSKIVSLTTPKLASHFQISSEKIQIIPNGVNTDLFKKIDKERAKQSFGLTGKKVIGYVGILREWVDFEMMLGALSKLEKNSIECYLFVVGGEGRIDELEAKAKIYGVQDRVISIGTLPYSEVPLAISAMDIGLIPFGSDTVAMNALPLKLFEYMACEVPVISQRIRPVIDAVGDNILYASNATELAEKIRLLLSSDSLRSDLGKRGRSIVTSKWNWQSIGKQLEAVLEAAASEKK